MRKQHQSHPRAVQPKIARAPQKLKQPVAPPVYRPQPAPKVLQRKMATTRQSANQTKPTPVAPPAYRPQPTPKVLQAKPSVLQPKTEAGARVPPTAPALYRPQPTPKCLQAKMIRTPTAPPVLQTKRAGINPREQYRHDTKRELATSVPRPPSPGSSVGGTNPKLPNRPHPNSVVQRKLWLVGDDAPTKPKYVQSRDDVYQEIALHVRGVINEVGFITEDTAQHLQDDKDILQKLTVISDKDVKNCIGTIHGRLINWAGDDVDRPQMAVEVAVKQAAESLSQEPLLAKVALAHQQAAEKQRLLLQEAENRRLAQLPVLNTDPQWLKDLITRFVGWVEGVKRFTDAVRDAKNKNEHSFLTGYEYQATEALKLGDSLGGMEVLYQGTYAESRYVDLVTKGGEMIECKVFAKKGEQPENIMNSFFCQALDYASSKTRINYRFKNGAPDWARQLLFCASFWGPGPISVNGNPVQFPNVIGGKNEVQVVKKAKGWYQKVTSQVAPPLN
ncbi:MAG: hypothetical protein QOH25_1363 [Acidobacteriota bacterium]|nr:hypothetical protein [Acidobacteriota bacterium]